MKMAFSFNDPVPVLTGQKTVKWDSPENRQIGICFKEPML